jgi:hypothetical protein
MTEILRIGNCSGFYGDRIDAAREMVDGGDIDVLVGDYLAELTMFILSKAKAAGRPGYATTFLRQMEDVMADVLDRGIKVVTNAGGLDPAGLADELVKLGERLGVAPKVAYITGDNILDQVGAFTAAGVDFRNIDTGVSLAESGHTPFTANAYLGGRGIARALAEGADIVVCPRVTDASLVVGPCLWKFGWADNDYDQIAGAVAAGHVIECGAQATGGNYAFFEETDTTRLPGFPIAEMRADGSSVITKRAGTGGAVSVGTVTAQLLYEVGPTDYLNPDVTLKLDTIQLSQEGPDRVLLHGTLGDPPPATLKVSMTSVGLYRQNVIFAIPGDHVEEKVAMLERGLDNILGGLDQFDDVSFRLVRHDQPEAELNELGVAQLHVSFGASDKDKVGRRIFDAATGLALSSIPGIYFPGERQQRPTQSGVNWPCLVPAELVKETVVLPDGTRVDIPTRDFAGEAHVVRQPPAPAASVDATRRTSLGAAFGARSGDKGAHANLGIWGRTPEAWAWLVSELTVDKFRELLPEAKDLEIDRAEFPNLFGVNFLVRGLLGDGAAAAGRFDPQAKGLAEFIRGRKVDLPEALLAELQLSDRGQPERQEATV